MSARKPLSLVQKHLLLDEIDARLAGEESVKPKRELPKNPPVELRGHPGAKRAWRYLVRIGNELESPLMGPLDLNLLIRLCLAYEQYWELVEVRRTVIQEGAIDLLLKTDARLDRKSALIHQLEGSLYLSPRSRAGAIPLEKLPEDDEEDSSISEGGWDFDELVKELSDGSG